MNVTKKCRCGRDLVCRAGKGEIALEKYFWTYRIKCECGLDTGENNSPVIAWKIARKMIAQVEK